MTTATGKRTAKGMRWIPGGSFAMGSEDFYPEERPVRTVAVGALWMDEHPVTNLEFGRFVKATGYVTVAERPPDPAAFPDADPDELVPGSLVFQPSAGPVDLRDFRNWWAYVPGAYWRRPEGPGSNLGGRERHPVVHVAHADAEAYAAWARKALPTEAEWEHAARGCLMMANTWQGEFPWQNLVTDGFERTSPVGSYRPNGFGLLDMTGNVWEWTCDDFTPDHSSPPQRPCCVPAAAEGEDAPRKVIKGGSHLCAPSYCLRYRPAARQSETVDTGTSHIGFRCVLRD